MRVMVGVIILYDHVHPVGAFAKTSKIYVSGPGGITATACPKVAVMSIGHTPWGHLCVS